MSGPNGKFLICGTLEPVDHGKYLPSFRSLDKLQNMRKTTALTACGMIAASVLCTHAAQLGQTEEAVLKEHGAPKSALNKGGTRILIYPEGRIKLDQGTVVEVSGTLAPADPTAAKPAAASLPATGMAPKSTSPAPIPAHLQPIINELVDKRHMRIDNPGLEKQRYILLYFADGSSKASARITSQLRYYYEKNKKGNNFEVLFVSADASAPKMTNHMAKQAMPWPALRFQAIESSGLLEHSGKVLPAMALLDAKGQVIASSEVDGQYKGCGAVLDALMQGL